MIRPCTDNYNEKAIYLAIYTFAKALGIEARLFVESNDGIHRLICGVNGDMVLGYDKYVWCYNKVFEPNIETSVLRQIREGIIDYYISVVDREIDRTELEDIAIERANEMLSTMTKNEFEEIFNEVKNG